MKVLTRRSTAYLSCDERPLSDVFKLDPEFEKNEKQYEEIRAEIIGDDDDSDEEGSDENGSGDDADGHPGWLYSVFLRCICYHARSPKPLIPSSLELQVQMHPRRQQRKSSTTRSKIWWRFVVKCTSLFNRRSTSKKQRTSCSKCEWQRNSR